ncbi:MAG: hypothetical protein ACU0DK_02130 [Pseudooceanicola sp.]
MPIRSTEDLFRNSVREDWVDLRDQIYTPHLTVLRDEVTLDPRLVAAETDEATGLTLPVFGVRDQKTSGRCAGYALAALVDVQRNLQHVRRDAAESHPKERVIVSADMLYQMALFHDRYPGLDTAAAPGRDGVRTLRSAIKGFYHHGVCPDWDDIEKDPLPDCWQSECYRPDPVPPGESQLFPTVPQAQKAREISLGAYYRLNSVLNHFHAALNEAQGILVSANVHDGWYRPWNRAAEGRIAWPPEQGKTGTHAFVIVGYDADGFHVLNSWGADWGGYRGQAGIALWSYADWAQNVVDAWVLRLGVSSPASFGASVGEKGIKGITGPVRAGSTPCLELVGHYMHLDDGFQVTTGSYPSFADGWGKTRDHLRDTLGKTKHTMAGVVQRRGVLLWLPGTLDGIKAEFQRAVHRKKAIKALGLYPYSIFWCHTFVEKSREVLTGLFDSCVEQAGADAAHLDDLIENRVRGVGRAFWRDIEIAARRSIAGTGELPFEADDQDGHPRLKPGFVMPLVRDLFDLVAERNAELHIVAEGAGVLLLHEILDHIDANANGVGEGALRGRRIDRLISSVHLIGPAIGMPRAGKQLLPFMARLNAGASGETGGEAAHFDLRHLAPGARARLYLPSPELEARMCYGAYGKSVLHLVSRAFEDRYRDPGAEGPGTDPLFDPPRQFLGMAGAVDALPEAVRRGVVLQTALADDLHSATRVDQARLNDDQAVVGQIFDCINSFRADAQTT